MSVERYDVQTEQLVPVTQEWVDMAQQHAHKRFIARHICMSLLGNNTLTLEQLTEIEQFVAMRVSPPGEDDLAIAEAKNNN